MKRNRIILATLIAFLVVLGMYFAVHLFQTPGDNGKTVRLLYWNVQNGMWDGQTDDYQRFTTWVAEQNADICVWAEAQKLYVTGTDQWEPEKEEECVNRWKRLAERYGHSYVYLSAHPDAYPQLITSRYPLEAEKLIEGNADTIVCHGASWYKMEMGKKTFNIVTLHTWPQRYGYHSTEENRQESIAKNEGDLFRRVEMEYICKETILSHPNAKNEYWAMMGDFNSVSKVDNNVYKLPENSTMFLVHDYITGETPYLDLIHELYPHQYLKTTGSNKRIDFIYVTPALYEKINYASVLYDGYCTPYRDEHSVSYFWNPSDHCPILMEFKQ